jgi:hypothetical protein
VESVVISGNALNRPAPFVPWPPASLPCASARPAHQVSDGRMLRVGFEGVWHFHKLGPARSLRLWRLLCFGVQF